MENIFDIKELHVCIEKYYGFYHIFRNNKFALHSRTPGSMNKFKPQIRKKKFGRKINYIASPLQNVFAGVQCTKLNLKLKIKLNKMVVSI